MSFPESIGLKLQISLALNTDTDEALAEQIMGYFQKTIDQIFECYVGDAEDAASSNLDIFDVRAFRKEIRGEYPAFLVYMKDLIVKWLKEQREAGKDIVEIDESLVEARFETIPMTTETQGDVPF